MDQPVGEDLAAWRPTLGAWPAAEGIHFRVWAATARRVELVLESGRRAGSIVPMTAEATNVFAAVVPGISAGDLYRYRLDGRGPYPDPASRSQPQGVHGPSEVVDATQFAWSDTDWRGVELDALIAYELHVGTYTPAGTFAGVIERLPYLRDLGVTAIELMPVGAFAGQRNWGYDSVAIFAPARSYGTPDDLRRLVDAAHRHEIGVLLDVVYNHVGPDGAYLSVFSPHYFSTRHRTPWGVAVNFDGPHSRRVRDFFIENALHWLHEYHLDGLRLDATHALFDDSPRHVLAELSGRIRGACDHGRRRALLIAEDHRNLATLVRPRRGGGWGLDAVWADDLHHQLRRMLAGDDDGYYRDFSGSAADLATTVRSGWFYRGQYSEYLGGPRGTDPSGLSPRQFVVCIQNHDQVGNRALGERLNHQIDPAAYRAASALLLCIPETPLLFMGQEWAASSPFLYFTDHHPELGRLVTEGRRAEFARFAAFADPQARERIPDPQAEPTFAASRLCWEEGIAPAHRATRRLYRALLRLRRGLELLRRDTWQGFTAHARGDGGLFLRYATGSESLVVAVRLRGAGEVIVADAPEAASGSWAVLLHTEDRRFSLDPHPARMTRTGSEIVVHFARPGAVVLHRGLSAPVADDASTGGEPRCE
jgi:maltooligosyltrehalose trehalohydrolase